MWFHFVTVLLAAAERDANLELLQLGLALNQLSSPCLRFMHIPKTGGTSIDAANMHHRIAAFDSLMRRTYERIAKARNLTVDLGDLYESSHESPEVYGGFLLNNIDLYHFIPQNATDQCEDLHTPPSRVPWIAEFYGECETFCSVRDPLERFWSAYRMRVGGGDWDTSCDVHDIEQRVMELLAEVTVKPYHWNCFWTPQVEFVYGTRNVSQSTRQYCTRILRQENLTAGFDELMAEIGRPDVKLPKEELLSDWSGCSNVTTSDLTPKTRKAIYEFFKADYEAFGYTPPKVT